MVATREARASHAPGMAEVAEPRGPSRGSSGQGIALEVQTDSAGSEAISGCMHMV